MRRSLAHIVGWSQQLVAEVLAPGDFAVDLTAGNGYDTLMLAKAVGPSGQVLAFDLQIQALETCAARLNGQGFVVHLPLLPVAPLPQGVSLVQVSHAELAHWCWREPRAIMANLGYLPGGDKNLMTRPHSTLAALRTGCKLLASGGRMVVSIYPGHSGGPEELAALDGFFPQLEAAEFDVLRLVVANRPQAPLLYVVDKLT